MKFEYSLACLHVTSIRRQNYSVARSITNIDQVMPSLFGLASLRILLTGLSG